MIEIDDDVVRENILTFLNIVKQEQIKVQDEDRNLIVFTTITLKYAAANNIVIPNFLTHKLVMKVCKFYETDDTDKSDLEVLQIVKDVIQHELTCPIKTMKLTNDEINRLIHFMKTLENKVI